MTSGREYRKREEEKGVMVVFERGREWEGNTTIATASKGGEGKIMRENCPLTRARIRVIGRVRETC